MRQLRSSDMTHTIQSEAEISNKNELALPECDVTTANGLTAHDLQ
jgi:hypothetical protein